MNSILVVIAARGGSKGIRWKNIKPLSGKPLIYYTIKQALKWGKGKRVIVSTDSQKIAGIATRYGAEVPFLRPKDLARDDSPKLRSIRDALIRCEQIFKERYDIIVDLDVTAPLRKVCDIDECLRIFLKKRPDSLFSVVWARKNPYFNMVEQKRDGFFKLCKRPSAIVTGRQNTPPVYHMNASIYFYTRDFLMDRRHITPFSNRTAVYVMDGLSGYDIDSEMDFRFIDFLIEKGVWKNEV